MRLSDAFAEVAERPIPKVPALRGRTVATVFMEPSTRTRLSFETAAKRLSADVMTFTAATSASVKGESLRDTVETLDAMGIDAMVIRHHASGAPLRVTDWVGASVDQCRRRHPRAPDSGAAGLLHDPRGSHRSTRRRGPRRSDRAAHCDRRRHQALACRPLERARLHRVGCRGRARGTADAHARVVGGLARDRNRRSRFDTRGDRRHLPPPHPVRAPRRGPAAVARRVPLALRPDTGAGRRTQEGTLWSCIPGR